MYAWPVNEIYAHSGTLVPQSDLYDFLLPVITSSTNEEEASDLILAMDARTFTSNLVFGHFSYAESIFYSINYDRFIMNDISFDKSELTSFINELTYLAPTTDLHNLMRSFCSYLKKWFLKEYLSSLNVPEYTLGVLDYIVNSDNSYLAYKQSLLPLQYCKDRSSNALFDGEYFIINSAGYKLNKDSTISLEKVYSSEEMTNLSMINHCVINLIHNFLINLEKYSFFIDFHVENEFTEDELTALISYYVKNEGDAIKMDVQNAFDNLSKQIVGNTDKIKQLKRDAFVSAVISSGSIALNCANLLKNK